MHPSCFEDHPVSQLKVCGHVASIFLRTFLHLICKVDKRDLKKIPRNGPFIIAVNHINFLEVPLMFVDLAPRKVHGVAKKETWNNPIIGWLATCWDSIKLDREGNSLHTFRMINKLLKEKKIIVVAPEGTRSGDGKLRIAHPGIISMAMKSNMPVIPVVHYGGEMLWENIAKFKRTSFTYKVGNPIILSSTKMSKEIRREMVDQLMLRLAILLPEKYRGVYSDLSKINNDYVEDIEFEAV